MLADGFPTTKRPSTWIPACAIWLRALVVRFVGSPEVTKASVLRESPAIRSVTEIGPALATWIPPYQSGSIPVIVERVYGLIGANTVGLTSMFPICTVPALISANSPRKIPNSSAPPFVPRRIGVTGGGTGGGAGRTAVELAEFGPLPGKIATNPFCSCDVRAGLLALMAAPIFTFCPCKPICPPKEVSPALTFTVPPEVWSVNSTTNRSSFRDAERKIPIGKPLALELTGALIVTSPRTLGARGSGVPPVAISSIWFTPGLFGKMPDTVVVS